MPDINEIDIKEIVTIYLKENGYEGLYNDECGCSLNDGLFPCCEPSELCAPAYICTLYKGQDYDQWLCPTKPRSEACPGEDCQWIYEECEEGEPFCSQECPDPCGRKSNANLS